MGTNCDIAMLPGHLRRGRVRGLIAVLLSVFAFLLTAGQASAEPWPVKVVVVTTFEEGADRGDRLGELQLWAEREELTETIDFPGGVHPLLTNKDRSVVAMVSGMGLVNAGASVMALAFDKRFDVRKAYWLLAGIAGVDPQKGTIGDAAWANYVVNDFAKSLDRKETPADWPYGIFPLQTHQPGQLPKGIKSYGPLDKYAEVFPLNQGLTRWAYELTRDEPLPYTEAMRAVAKDWKGYPEAQRPPRVIIGDSFASNHFWHGRIMTQWARDWVHMFTGGKGTFVMSNMEDSAVASAMVRLDAMGLADRDRLMVLRTASNYTMPHDSETAFQSLTAPFPFDGRPAFEAAYRVGARVVRELTTHWDRYADHVPGAE